MAESYPLSCHRPELSSGGGVCFMTIANSLTEVCKTMQCQRNPPPTALHTMMSQVWLLTLVPQWGLCGLTGVTGWGMRGIGVERQQEGVNMVAIQHAGCYTLPSWGNPLKGCRTNHLSLRAINTSDISPLVLMAMGECLPPPLPSVGKLVFLLKDQAASWVDEERDVSLEPLVLMVAEGALSILRSHQYQRCWWLWRTPWAY